MAMFTAASGDEVRFATRLAAEAMAQQRDSGRAARVVAGRSLGLEDCVELLSMLGLTAEAEPAPLDEGS